VNRTDRLYAIVEELRTIAPRPRTVAWLAGRFEITERTIHRDLLALQEAGVPMWSQPGPGGGYFVDPAMTLPPINLTTDEALAVAIALALGESHPFASSALSALGKITVALQTDNVVEVKAFASRIRSVPSTRTTDVRGVLEAAVRAQKVVRIAYVDNDAIATERDVEPHSFLSGRGSWYLFGWCRLRTAGRGFRLDRIASAVMLDEDAPPREFSEVAGDLANLAVIPAVLRTALLGESTTRAVPTIV
jgi:predicted DNA-binding transcriptional regulator YafY